MARARFGLVSALSFVVLATSISSSAWAQEDDDILFLDEEEAPASAGPKPKLGFATLVPVGAADQPLADQVTRGLQSELKSAFAITALSLPGGGRGAARIDVDAGKSSLAKAQKNIQRGQQYLGRMNLRKAGNAFQAAIRDFERAAPAIDDITPVLEAWLGLAEISARQSDEEGATAALAQVARLSPELELDAARYPPLFIRTFDRVRAKTLKEAPGALFVDASGAGAEVRLDGRVIGTAPLRVQGVPAGQHYVRVFRDGQGLMGAVVNVDSRDETTVRPGFVGGGEESPLDALANNRFPASMARQVAEVARKAGVDLAVVGVVGRTELAVPTVLVGIEPSSGKVGIVGPLEFDGDLLNLAIEGLRGREGLDKLVKSGGFQVAGDDALVPGMKSAAAVEVAEVTLRFKIKAPTEPRRKSRVLGGPAQGEEDEEDAVQEDRRRRDRVAGRGDGRRTLSGGGAGRSKSLRDDDDPYAEAGKVSDNRRKELLDEDVPLTEQPWFWPVAIGGGVAGAALLAGGATVGLVAAGVVPDPRPNGGLEVQVNLP